MSKLWGFVFFGATVPSGPEPPHSRGFYIKHNDAPQSVGLLWTSDRFVAETYSPTTNIHAAGRIGTHNLNRQAVADLRFRPCGHWDRQNYGVDEGENIKVVSLQGGGVYKDCGVSSTYGLSSIRESEGGDGAVGWRLSCERMKNYAYGVFKGRQGGK